MHARLCSISLLLVALGFSSTASAEDTRWREEWPRVRPVEVIIGATGLAVSAAGGFVIPEPHRNWEGRNDFDEWVRDGLRARGQRTRKTTAAVSDGLFYGLVAYPLLVDAVLVTWAGRGDGTTAGQLALLDLFAIGTSGLLATASEQSGRARPFARTCDGPEPDDECAVGGLDKGFFSGHTVAAFTGAGLVCVEHRSLRLYGARAADVLACAGALAVASTSAVFRVTSDNHYASDVLVGATVGLATGYVLPSLLHFGWSSYASRPIVTPTVDARGARVEMGGAF